MAYSDWGAQEEYDAVVNEEVIYNGIKRQLYGGYMESFVIGKEGFVFLVSSDLGGNVWRGYIGVYETWEAAKSSRDSPFAYHIDDSTTFSSVISLDDNTIICGADKATVDVFRFSYEESRSDIRPLSSLFGHDNCVTSLSLFSDAKYLATGSMDCFSKCWDLEVGSCISSFDAAQEILDVAASPTDANLYCVASRCGGIFLVDSRICSSSSPSVLKKPASVSIGSYPTALNWSSPELIFAGYSDGSLVLFDLQAMQSAQCANGFRSSQISKRPHCGAITTIDISTEKSLLLTGSEDGSVCVTNWNEGKNMEHCVVGNHDGFVRCVKWDRQSHSSTIFSAGWDGVLMSFSYSNLNGGNCNER